MIFTEEELRYFALPLSATEDARCKNAISMIRDALKGIGLSDGGVEIKALYENTYAYGLNLMSQDRSRKVKIFVQGSYANNTNVRGNSDVDVAVIQEDIFQTNYRSTQSDADYGFVKAKTSDLSFKDEVQKCLEDKFGPNYVERHDKSIFIIGNSYHQQADSVPCQRYRDYSSDYLYKESNYIGGVVIKADSGERIINYPEQHIKNGAIKNIATNHWFKKMVRIIKKFRYLMKDDGIESAKKVSSFGLESLLWNIPDTIYGKYDRYIFNFEEIIDYLEKHINDIATYTEANGIKPLCPDLVTVNYYKRFVTDLNLYFEHEG